MIIDSPIISGSSAASGSLNQFGNVTITGSVNVSGSFTSTGTITAQTLVVQTITSSVVYSSGSNVFGNSLANTQVFTGSVSITGSLAVNGSNAVLTNQTSSMSASYAANATSASYANNSTSASYALTASYSANVPITASYANNANSASYAATSSFVTTAQTASFVTTAQTASYVLNAVSSSFATSASNALTASYLSGYVSPFPFTGSAIISGSLYTYGLVTHDSIISGSQPANNPSSSLMLISGSINPTGSASGSSAVLVNTVMSASANNQTLVGLDINPTFTTGSFTGVSNLGLRVGGFLNVDISNKSLNIINDGTLSALRGIAVYQNNNGVQAAAMQFFKSRGTNASPTAVANGDVVGAFTFRPYIAGAYTTDRSLFGASMTSTTGISQYFIAGTTDSNYTPNLLVAENGNTTIGNLGSGTIITSLTLPTSKLQVAGNTAIGYTTATAAPSNGLTVSGNTLIGTTTDAGYKLDVNGTARVNGNTQITGSLNVSGSITTTGTITAQTLVVQTVSSSIIYSSGSNTFGNDLANTQKLTGSVSITGSLAVNGSNVILSNQTSSMSVATASYVQNAVTASYVQTSTTASYWSGSITNALSASYAANSTTASYVASVISASYAASASNALAAQTASYVQTATTASYIQNAVSASYAASASNALAAQTASYVTTAQTASYVANAVSASYAASSSNSLFAQTASYWSGSITNALSASYAASASNASSAASASYALTASYSANVPVTSSYANNAASASYALTASYSANVPVTSSYANNAASASYSLTASYAANVPQTSSYAISASNALTASYLSGYVSPFPFTGSAIISGSLTVTGSVNISGSNTLIGTKTITGSVFISGSKTIVGNNIVTGSMLISGSFGVSGSITLNNLSGNGVRYLVTDSSGSVTAQSASAAIINNQVFTSSAGQTTFAITNGYTTGLIETFINGTKLTRGLEYTDTSGTSIVLLTGSFAGDIVEFVSYQPASGVTNNNLRQVTYFTASAGQTTFSASYVPGLLDVFYNGSKLTNATDYTAANGTSIIFTTASNAGDIIEVDVYSYQVGAFSGIGGTGVANQFAYFTSTNAVTSSTAITISGANAIVTGSLLGTASFASNADLLDGLDSTVFTLTSSFAAQTASFTAFSASHNSFTASILAQTASLNSFSASVLTFTGSASTRLGALEAATSSLYSYTSSLNNKTASFATTGSNTFIGTQTISGSILQSGSFTSTGTLTAQTLVVQTITSSVVYSSGSNIFGNALTNTQVFSGSVSMNPGGLFVSGSGLVGIGTTTPAYNLDVTGTFRATGAATFSSSVTANGNAYIQPNAASNNVGLFIQNNSTGGYGSSLALGLYGYSTSAYFNPLRIEASYPGYGLVNFYVKSQSNSTEISALQLSGTGAATFSSSVSIGGADQGYQLDVKRTSTGDSTFDTVANFYKASTHNTGLLLRLKNTIVDLAANNITGGGGPTAGMSFSVSSGGTISTALTIASTGAACFACELTAKTIGTNDLLLNNLNYECANYVDGTRGSWLIQEGACDLFIINQVSCKKYKFNLIEIK